jgi:hypothetical protein
MAGSGGCHAVPTKSGLFEMTLGAYEIGGKVFLNWVLTLAEESGM